MKAGWRDVPLTLRDSVVSNMHYMGVSLILEKLFSRSSLYGMACFSLLASEPHLDATKTSKYFQKFHIDAIIINRGPFIWILLYCTRLFL